jgi:hypothetical protein
MRQAMIIKSENARLTTRKFEGERSLGDFVKRNITSAFPEMERRPANSCHGNSQHF